MLIIIIKVRDYYKPYISHRQNAQNIRTKAPNSIMLLLFTYTFGVFASFARGGQSALNYLSP
jgi:hypothetical protein